MPRSHGFVRIFTPTIRLFMTAMILANLAWMMFYPFFALLLANQGYSVQSIGLYFTAAAIFPLAMQIFGGWVSDRIGRLRSIAIGSAAGAISWVGIISAPHTNHPLVWYLVSSAVGSITAALVSPSYDAFLAEQSDEKNRTRVYGVLQAVFMIVGILGPPLGGLIVERYSYGTLVLCSAGLVWASTLIRIYMARNAVRFGAPPPATQGMIDVSGGMIDVGGDRAAQNQFPAYTSFRSGLKGIAALAFAGGLFTWLLIVDGVFDISGRIGGDLLPLFLREVGSLKEASIGTLQSAMAICNALAMIPIGAFADRRGERYPIALGAFLVAAGSFIMAAGKTYPVFLAGHCVLGLAAACSGPSLQSLISKAVPERLRGLAFGFLSTSLGLFSFLAPALGAFLWKQGFPALPLIVSGCLALAIVPFALTRLRTPLRS